MVNSTLVLTLYVNPMKGNDTNIGSRLSPFQSLTRALKVTKIPTIIHLASGTYNIASGCYTTEDNCQLSRSETACTFTSGNMR
jgi:Protein of unknown function (DUF1565)